jgi:hypothetical protein
VCLSSDHSLLSQSNRRLTSCFMTGFPSSYPSTIFGLGICQNFSISNLSQNPSMQIWQLEICPRQRVCIQNSSRPIIMEAYYLVCISVLYYKKLTRSCVLVVTQSRNTSTVGIEGIVIHETENAFKIITGDDKLKSAFWITTLHYIILFCFHGTASNISLLAVIPKQGTIFEFAVPLWSTLDDKAFHVMIPPAVSPAPTAESHDLTPQGQFPCTSLA